jgi:hypothetical protein
VWEGLKLWGEIGGRRRGDGDTLGPPDEFVDMQREQMYFVPVSRPGYTAPQCESEKPTLGERHGKEKTSCEEQKTAKRQSTRKAETALEVQP